jgi:hypothetical protein
MRVEHAALDDLIQNAARFRSPVRVDFDPLRAHAGAGRVRFERRACATAGVEGLALFRREPDEAPCSLRFGFR